MEVEFTARQVKISKALRTQAEEGLARIARILGRTAHASVTFGVQRHLQTAEITVQARTQLLAARGEADTLESALRMALSHEENKACRYRDRKLTRKRLPREEKVLTALPVVRPKSRTEPAEKNGKLSRTTHANHSRTVVVEAHIHKSTDPIMTTAMSIEEAVKEVEARDSDLLIFRNPAGDLHVLHRKHNGHIELIEVP